MYVWDSSNISFFSPYYSPRHSSIPVSRKISSRNGNVFVFILSLCNGWFSWWLYLCCVINLTMHHLSNRTAHCYLSSADTYPHTLRLFKHLQFLIFRCIFLKKKTKKISCFSSRFFLLLLSTVFFRFIYVFLILVYYASMLC